MSKVKTHHDALLKVWISDFQIKPRKAEIDLLMISSVPQSVFGCVHH